MKKDYVKGQYLDDHIPKWCHYGRWDNEGLKCYGKDPYVPIIDYSRGYTIKRKEEFEETK